MQNKRKQKQLEVNMVEKSFSESYKEAGVDITAG